MARSLEDDESPSKQAILMALDMSFALGFNPQKAKDLEPYLLENNHDAKISHHSIGILRTILEAHHLGDGALDMLCLTLIHQENKMTRNRAYETLLLASKTQDLNSNVKDLKSLEDKMHHGYSSLIKKTSQMHDAVVSGRMLSMTCFELLSENLKSRDLDLVDLSAQVIRNTVDNEQELHDILIDNISNAVIAYPDSYPVISSLNAVIQNFSYASDKITKSMEAVVGLVNNTVPNYELAISGIKILAQRGKTFDEVTIANLVNLALDTRLSMERRQDVLLAIKNLAQNSKIKNLDLIKPLFADQAKNQDLIDHISQITKVLIDRKFTIDSQIISSLIESAASSLSIETEENIYSVVNSVSKTQELSDTAKQFLKLKHKLINATKHQVLAESIEEVTSLISETKMVLPSSINVARQYLVSSNSDLQKAALGMLMPILEYGKLDMLTSHDIDSVSRGLDKIDTSELSINILFNLASNQKVFSKSSLNKLAEVIFHDDSSLIRKGAHKTLIEYAKHNQIDDRLASILDLEAIVSLEPETLTKLKNSVEIGEILTKTNFDLLEKYLDDKSNDRQKEIVYILTCCISHNQAIPASLLEKAISFFDNEQLIKSIKFITDKYHEGSILDLALQKLHIETAKSETSDEILSAFCLAASKQTVSEQTLNALEDLLTHTSNNVRKAAFSTLRKLANKDLYIPSAIFFETAQNLITEFSDELIAAGLAEKLSASNDSKLIFWILDELINRDSIDPQVIASEPIENWCKILLIQGMINNTDEMSEVYKFCNSATEFEKIYSDDPQQFVSTLKNLLSWKKTANLSLATVSQIMPMISNVKDEIVVEHDIIKLKKFYLEGELKKHHPEIILDEEQLSNAVTLLDNLEYDVSLIEKLLQKSYFQEPKDLVDFLSFAQRNQINHISLTKSLDSENSLKQIQISLSKQILSDSIYQNISTTNFRLFDEIKDQLPKLLNLGWRVETLCDLVEKVGNNSKSLQPFVDAISVINDYNIPEQDFFDSCDPQEWPLRLNKIGVNLNFKSEIAERDLDALQNEILNLNRLNPKITDGINSGFFKDKVAEIFSRYESSSVLSKEQILQWAKDVRSNPMMARDPNFLPEMIAVIKRANLLDTGHELRISQIISMLAILDTKDHGRLAQISTGEGKSTITASIAVIKVLQGHQVDVITSSPVLAKRDAEEKAEFFSLFDIKVMDNTDSSIASPKDCYSCDIVYGNISNFQFDLLRHEYEGLGTRGERKLDVAVIDEVDSMLIDEGSTIAKISTRLAGMEFLNQLFATIWYELENIDKHFVWVEEKQKLLWIEGDFKLENGRIILATGSEDGTSEPNVLEVDNQREFISYLLKGFVESIINNENDHSKVIIPKHLRDFASSQSASWINSAISAKYLYKKNKEYIIGKDKEGRDAIIPVDYANTGVIQTSTKWTNGLHQFVEIKHNLRISAESVTTSFISNLGYFKRYGNNIFGMTGTLGSKDSQDLLTSTYNIDLVFIPTYKAKQFIELPSVIAPNEERWISEIIADVQKEVKNRRAVLIICETIKTVSTIEKMLKKQKIGSSVKRYARSDNDESAAVDKNIDAREIIVATNLAGRGTDIKTTNEVEKNGGLHVCLTFLPSNLRVEQQAFGRTSRQGKKGTSRLVIDSASTLTKLKYSYPSYSKADSIQDIKQWRDLSEQSRLQHIKSKKVDTIVMEDELFQKFCLLRSSTNDQNIRKQIEELWGIWLKKLRPEEESGFKKLLSGDLKQNALDFGFDCIDVAKDGNCFYHAVSDQLKRHNNENYSSDELREICIAHILDNTDLYKEFMPDGIDSFIYDHAQSGMWVDDIMIRSLSRALNVNIIIIRSDGANPNIFKRENPDSDLYLGYMTEGHYQSLIPLKQETDITKDIFKFLEAAEPDTAIFEQTVLRNINPEVLNVLANLEAKKMHDTTAKNESIKTKAIMQFEDFAEQIRQKISSPEIYQNPFYALSGAWHNGKSPYDRALDLDSIYGFPAYYKRAEHLIQRDGEHNKQAIVDDLAKAKQIIEEFMIPQLQGICILLGLKMNENILQERSVSYKKKWFGVLPATSVNQDIVGKTSSEEEYSDLAEQIMAKIDILKIQIKYIKRNIETICNSQRKVKISASYQMTEKVDKAQEYKEELAELAQIGLDSVFEVEEVPPPKKKKNFWKGAIAATLGVCQIVVGAAMAICTAGVAAIPMAAMFIAEGAKDLYFGVKGAISGDFSWKDYWIQKGISVSISMG